ncbi:hypothetical protein RF11_00500 [Thelohanellus kitauei]|uniref:Uncharacterized protein n=1 Tax=Thelohanellus kitauei TaxID=669202 RepID=A0A0C2IT63_THEKT|nr:hypothetical protein RF11_00500 [Thelohanellus kitauei]
MMLDIADDPYILDQIALEPALNWASYEEFRKPSNAKQCCIRSFRDSSTMPVDVPSTNVESVLDDYVQFICDSVMNDIAECLNIIEYVPFKEYYSMKDDYGVLE